MGEAKRRKARKIECQAQISVCSDVTGLLLESNCINEPDNPAVMFAKWICDNAVSLMQQMVQQQATERLKLVEPNPRIAAAAGGTASAAVELVGPDGKPLQ